MERKRPSSSKLPDNQLPIKKSFVEASTKSTKVKDYKRIACFEESGNAGSSGVQHGHLDSRPIAEDKISRKATKKLDRKRSSSLKSSNEQHSSKKRVKEISRESVSGKRKDFKTKSSKINPVRDLGTDEVESEDTFSDDFKRGIIIKSDSNLPGAEKLKAPKYSSSLPSGRDLPQPRKSSTKKTKENVYKIDSEDSSSDELGKAGSSGFHKTSSKQTSSAFQHDHLYSLAITKDESSMEATGKLERKSSPSLKLHSSKKKVEETSRQYVSGNRKDFKIKSSSQINPVRDLNTDEVESEDTFSDDFKRGIIKSDSGLPDAEKLKAPKYSSSLPSGRDLTEAKQSSPTQRAKGRALKKIDYCEDSSSDELGKAGPSGVQHGRLHSRAVSEDKDWTEESEKEEKRSSPLKLSKKQHWSKKKVEKTSLQALSSKIKDLKIKSSFKSNAVKDSDTDAVRYKISFSVGNFDLGKSDSNLSKDNDLADTEKLSKKTPNSSASLPSVQDSTKTSKSSPFLYWGQVQAKKDGLEDNTSAQNAAKTVDSSPNWEKFKAIAERKADIEKRIGSKFETGSPKNAGKKGPNNESSDEDEQI